MNSSTELDIAYMTNIEKQLADKIARANGLNLSKLGLRFDKVVVRLLENLRNYVELTNIKDVTVLMTITAPIKLATKTAYQLEVQIKDLLDSENYSRDRRITIFQNEVRLRIVKSSSRQPDRFIGLVHNPSADSKRLLDLATRWLIKG